MPPAGATLPDAPYIIIGNSPCLTLLHGMAEIYSCARTITSLYSPATDCPVTGSKLFA